MPDSKFIKGSVTRDKLPDAAAANVPGAKLGTKDQPVPTTIGCGKGHENPLELPVPTTIGCGKPHKKSPPAKKPAKKKAPAKKK